MYWIRIHRPKGLFLYVVCCAVAWRQFGIVCGRYRSRASCGTHAQAQTSVCTATMPTGRRRSTALWPTSFWTTCAAWSPSSLENARSAACLHWSPTPRSFSHRHRSRYMYSSLTLCGSTTMLSSVPLLQQAGSACEAVLERWHEHYTAAQIRITQKLLHVTTLNMARRSY